MFSFYSTLTEEKCKKDFWDKLKIIAYTIGVISLIIATYVGNRYTNAIKEREIQGDFVELAVSILRERPDTTIQENYNIRDWAVEIINLYSEVELNDSIQEELRTKTTFPQKPKQVLISSEPNLKGDLLIDLINKNLLQGICSAKNILKSRALNSEVEAAKGFREVMQQLSYESILQLDKDLTTEANSDFHNKHYKEAATKYKILFNPYYKYCK